MGASPPFPDEVSRNTPMCKEHALFLHSISPGFMFLMPLFFAIVSALFTQGIRHITPGVGDKPKTPKTPAADDTSSTRSSDVDIEASEAPPPYESSAIPSTTAPTTAQETPANATEAPAISNPKRSSAQNFVIGSALLACLLFSLFCLALSLQWMTFCQIWSPTSTFVQVLCWLFFCIAAFWATCGVTCYAMLVRDLWGKRARERWSWNEGVLLQWLFMGFFFMIAFPFAFIGLGCIGLVERAQRKWCGDELEEEGEGLAGNGVELRRPEEIAGGVGAVIGGTARVSSEEDNEESVEAGTEREDYGENMGLIQGIAK